MKNNVRTRKIYSFAAFSKLLFELVIWMLYLKSVGWTVAEIGLLQALINFTQFFAELPSGVIADKFGRKKTIAIGQIFIILYILSFFAAYSTHWIVYFGFILYGLGLSLVSGADQALIYDNIDGTSYSKVFGRYNAIAILAIALSSLLGGFMADVSWNLVFMGTAISQLVALVVILSFPEKRNSVKQNGSIPLKKFIFNAIRYVKQHPEYLYLMTVISITQGTISILYQYGSLLLNEFSVSTGQISTVFFVIAILSSISSFKLDRLIEIQGANQLVKRAFSLGILAILSLIIDNTWAAIISFMVVNILFEIWDTTLNTIIQNEISEDQRTTMLSLVNQATAFLMGTESLIIGFLSKRVSVNMIFMLMGTFTLFLGLWLFSKYTNLKKNNY